MTPRPTPAPSAQPTTPAARPETCPFCRSRAVGTLAKVITDSTHWRCQSCGEGWTARSAGLMPRKDQR